MKVFKYVLQDAFVQDLDIPVGARILAVQAQYQDICLWAAVDEGMPATKRTIVISGTGITVEGQLTYLGTVQLHEGRIVLHVFERLNHLTLS